MLILTDMATNLGSLAVFALLCQYILWPAMKHELVAELAKATATEAPAAPANPAQDAPDVDLSKQLQTIMAADGIKAYFVQDGQVHEAWRQGEGWKLTCLAPGHPTPDRRYQLRVEDDNGVSVIYRTEDGNLHEIFIGRQTDWEWACRPCTAFH